MKPVVRATRISALPLSRLPTGALVALLLIGGASIAAEPSRTTGEGTPNKGTKPATDPGAVEVRFTDNSTMKLTVKEDRIELVTSYGKLYVPVNDIRRIEFGMRLSDEQAKRIDTAISTLGGPQFRSRELAGAELLALREKAYHALLKATKSSDMEVAHRAEELLAKIREAVPEELLNMPAHDVVYTDESKIAGKISTGSLRVSTYQFGEQQLKLADVRSLRSLAAIEPEVDTRNVQTDPGNLKALEGQVGKTFTFRVTGGLGGSLWGTDVYTTDSTLATAAVHAGLVQPGHTAIVRVTITGPQGAFQGSTRNGITSSGYANYPGSYRVHR